MKQDWKQIARREYLRGLINGGDLPVDYSVEYLDKLYAEYLEANPDAEKEIQQAIQTELQNQAKEMIGKLEERQFEEPYTLGMNYAIGTLQKYLKSDK